MSSASGFWSGKKQQAVARASDESVSLSELFRIDRGHRNEDRPTNTTENTKFGEPWAWSSENEIKYHRIEIESVCEPLQHHAGVDSWL